MEFIDIGANLTDPQFQGIYHGSSKHPTDLTEVIERAKEQKVTKILVTGSSLKESIQAVELCREYPDFLYCTAGIHPCSSKEVPTNFQKRVDYYLDLVSLIKSNPNVVKSFGEIGLDYDRFHYASKEIQQAVFQEQLVLASVLDLPLFLHSRNCAEDFRNMILNPISTISPVIQEVLMKAQLPIPQLSNGDVNGTGGSASPLRGVVHSFTGTKEEARELLDLGFYIGINGCSLKTDENLEVAKSIPLSKLMLETDGPWCEIRPAHASFKYVSPLPYKSANKPAKKQENSLVRGRCEPCQIVQVAEVIAGLHDTTVMQVAHDALSNTLQLFKF